MGNAFIARVDDESAPFHNPAGLGTVRRGKFYLTNFQLGANKHYGERVYSSLANAIKYSMNAFSPETMRQLHRSKPGQYSHTHLAMAPNYTMRYLSFGYLYSRRARAYYGGEPDDLFSYSERIDHGPYASGNISLYGGIFKAGLALTWLQRHEISGAVDASQEFSPTSAHKAKGSALMQTAGARITLPITHLPSFAATLHNIAGKSFSRNTEFSQAPSNIERNLVLGFSITPALTRSTKMHIEVNYKDFNKKYDYLKDSARWSAGTEFNFSRTLFLRVGLHNMLVSGGVGVKIRHFRFDISTYAVKGDPSHNSEKSDRRLALSTSLLF